MNLIWLLQTTATHFRRFDLTRTNNSYPFKRSCSQYVLFLILYSFVPSQVIIMGEKKKNGTRVIKNFDWFMVFNATFNNISVISWQSVLLVEETRVPGESHWPVVSQWQTWSHNVVSSIPRHEWGSNSQR